MPRDDFDYDVLIAGARCAGAPLAMLLARQGLRVLVVDPLKRGSDTLSTHALMRGAVLQLHRWGVLEAVREAGTPPIHRTTFHYGSESVEVPIKPRDGIDALYAPRRTVLDALLVEAAEASGATVAHGSSVVALLRDPSGRVTGALIGGGAHEGRELRARVVIGADGMRSRVARLVEAPVRYTAPHTAASLYGYWRDIPDDGNHWYYDLGASVGTIPTNDGQTCVFASVRSDRLREGGEEGLRELHQLALGTVSQELADRVAGAELVSGLRAFAGAPGFLRDCVGDGWALVGDAAYFKDPITAHGITDAFVEAELLARAIACGDDRALHDYQDGRDARVRTLMDVTDRIASMEWDLAEVKELHLTLSREMKAEVQDLLGLDGEEAA